MSEFENKRAVVTGAAGAVGRVVAQAFHDAGAFVTGIDIVEHEAPYRTLVADLIDPEGARGAVSEAGEIDILANIAGGFTMGDTIAETADDTWDFMMNLNARTVLNMTRAVVPGMVARGSGKIVNIGARGALRGAAAMGAYVASKSVVRMRLSKRAADSTVREAVASRSPVLAVTAATPGASAAARPVASTATTSGVAEVQAKAGAAAAAMP